MENVMETPVLHATTREITGKQVKQLRNQGLMPGVVYGQDHKSQNISIEALAYVKALKKSGTSTLVNLIIDGGKPVKVLFHEPQEHPTKPAFVHADFYVVKMNEKLQTEIALHFIGESAAVADLDGTLNTQIEAISVECFPDKLVPHIEVDIAQLATFDDIIRISDITAPEGIEILDDADMVVATVTQPISEEALAALDEAIEDTSAADVELAGEKKEAEESTDAS
jgi:large subunit ribosomal protein L25